MGRFSSRWSRIWATTCGSPAESPASITAGSPGSRCCRAKTITLTNSIVGMICRSLVPIELCIVLALAGEVHTLESNDAVRHRIEAKQGLFQAEDILRRPEIEHRQVLALDLPNLGIERGAVRDRLRNPRLVEQRIHLLVIVMPVVESVAAMQKGIHVAVRIRAAGP